MKVVYFSHYTSMYGANKCLIELIKRAKELYKIQPIVITPDRGDINLLMDSYGIENYIFEFRHWTTQEKFFDDKNKINELYQKYINTNIKAIDDICELLKTKNIDIIHTNATPIDIGAYVAQKLNIPHIWHIREFLHEDYNLKFYCNFNEAAEKINKLSDKVLFMSEVLKNKYAKFIDKSKLQVIYEGVENSDNENTVGNKKRGFNIVFLGLISPNKNQYELVKAMDILINIKGYKDIKVSLIGDGDIDYINSMKNFIKEKNLINNIEFKGYVENPQKILSQYQVGVMCSKCEAFGRVTVEYMMNGLITIAPNTGANEEIIDNEKNGYIYIYNNPQDLSNKIQYIYDNYDKLKYIKENAIAKIKEKFNLEDELSKIYKVYNEVVSNQDSKVNDAAIC